MPKFFSVYGFLVLFVFAVSAHKGYAWLNLFSSTAQAAKTESHYHK